MESGKQKYEKIANCHFFDDYKKAGFIGEFIIGSDILNLRTDKSDIDILFLYQNRTDYQSSYDPNYKNCSRFLTLGKDLVQWKCISLPEVKEEILCEEEDERDFALLASLVKIGMSEALVPVIDIGNKKIYDNICKLREYISLCALRTFLWTKFYKYSESLQKIFLYKKLDIDPLINQKFWYTAFLGYYLLHSSSSYDKNLVKKLKDMKYGEIDNEIVKNEKNIISKIEVCYNYYKSNYPEGVKTLVNLIYDMVISNKEGNYGIQCCFNKNI